MKDTKRIHSLTTDLEKAQVDLSKAKKVLSKCHLRGHQTPIYVTAGVHCITVANVGGPKDGYSSVLQSGCDMIMLGIKKILAKEVDIRQAKVTDIENQLQEAVNGK